MMGGRAARRLAALMAAALVCGIVLSNAAHAQLRDGSAALNAEILKLYQEGKYAEAAEIAERQLAIVDKTLGPEHLSTATSLNTLAILYWNLGRFPEAEPLYKRSLAIREKALGPDHSHVGVTLNNLAELYRSQSRYA